MDFFTANSWILTGLGLVSAILFAVTLYFTLTYFEHLKNDDAAAMKNAKMSAVLALLLAFGLPALYQLFIVNSLMQ